MFDDGQVIAIGEKVYSVRSAEEWDYPFSSVSFQRLLTVDATLKRKGSIVGGKRSGLVDVASVKLVPLTPASHDVLLREKTSGSLDLFETFASGDGKYYHLVLEDVKEING